MGWYCRHIVALVVLLHVSAGCAAERAAPPATPTAAGEEFSNPALGYSWILPADWEPVSPESLWSSVPGQDVRAAKKKGQRHPAIWAFARDLVQIVPGSPQRDPEKLMESAQSHAAFLLEAAGGKVLGARHVPMLGHEAIEVSGNIGEDAVSIRTFYVGYRHFELRCLGAHSTQDWACADAVRAFRIGAAKNELSEQQVPRMLHLREPKLGFGFDPPDDSWLAYGPRTGAGGTQTVWFWNKQGRQVDVGVMILPSTATGVNTDTFAARMALSTRQEGSSVTERASTLAGKPCRYLEVTKPDGTTQDTLVLVDGGFVYMLLITQPTRDMALVEIARRGFRLISD
jgi:hypothetical protein